MHMYMHVYVYAYSGGRLLLFMQEGVAFCWATSGARACAPNSDSHWGQYGQIGIYWGQQGSTLGPIGIHTGIHNREHTPTTHTYMYMSIHA